MNTPIGQCLRANIHLRIVFSFLALLIILIDLWLVTNTAPVWTRLVLAMVILPLYLLLASGDRYSLGFRLTPIQPLSHWIRLILIIGFAMLIPISAFWLTATFLNWELTIPQTSPEQAGLFFLYGCVLAPFFEEVIYRLVLCFPTTTTLGTLGAILFSGIVFASIHFLYGNPGPDNFFAGYIFAWIYLKSGSIMVPILVHSLGNFVVLIFYVGMWYFS
jgi:membrane protease YdiL (CAAX protease family)